MTEAGTRTRRKLGEKFSKYSWQTTKKLLHSLADGLIPDSCDGQSNTAIAGTHKYPAIYSDNNEYGGVHTEICIPTEVGLDGRVVNNEEGSLTYNQGICASKQVMSRSLIANESFKEEHNMNVTAMTDARKYAEIYSDIKEYDMVRAER